jgi:hypothetical protein
MCGAGVAIAADTGVPVITRVPITTAGPKRRKGKDILATVERLPESWRYVDRVSLGDLPYIDEHEVTVDASPDTVWDAILGTFESFAATASARAFTRALGCDPGVAAGWDEPGVGTAAPGFRVIEAHRPGLLVVAGRHRFSRYGIIFRVEDAAWGTRCSAESRAEFPGRHGRLYRRAVIGTNGYVFATRRLLDQIAARATT